MSRVILININTDSQRRVPSKSLRNHIYKAERHESWRSNVESYNALGKNIVNFWYNSYMFQLLVSFFNCVTTHISANIEHNHIISLERSSFYRKWKRGLAHQCFYITVDCRLRYSLTVICTREMNITEQPRFVSLKQNMNGNIKMNSITAGYI